MFPDRIGCSVTFDLGSLLVNGSGLIVHDDGRFIYICPNESDVSYYLCFDRLTGLLMDASLLGNDAYCYSNQQTEWAFTLGEELFDNSDLIWDYLNGLDANIDGLNISTQDMLRTCYGFSTLSTLFGGSLLSDVNLLISNIGLDEYYEVIMPLVGGIVSSIDNFGPYIVDEYLTNPKFLTGVAGGLLFEAGMIAICTGVGAPIGIALMGAGTLCTAYSSGLIDFNDNGVYFNNTSENQLNFGFSMLVNCVTGGGGGFAARSSFKALGGRVSQVSIRNVVSNVDQRGLYSTTLYSTQKYAVTKDSTKPVGKYIIKELVRTENPTKKDYIFKFSKSYGQNFFESLAYKIFISGELSF